MDHPSPTTPASGHRRTRRQAETGVDPAALDRLQGFCLGPDGRAAAASELHRLGLTASPDHIDDLCQAVLVGVWGRLAAGAEGHSDGLNDVVAYARRSIRNAAVDRLRAGRREALRDLLAEGERDPAPDPPTTWSDATTDDAAAPLVRHHLQLMLVARSRLDAWVVAGGLTLTHLADHPELELWPETPVPSPRSRAANHASRWAALHYAGRHDCFEEPETGAVRQRRSIALQRLERTFTEAVAQTVESSGP